MSERERAYIYRVIRMFARAPRFVDKTAENCLRVPYLDELFPDARFVFIRRDAPGTVNSLIEAWRARPRFVKYRLPETLDGLGELSGNRWSFALVPGWRELRDASLEEICARQYVACNEAALDAFEDIDPARRVEVTYERMFAEPLETARELYDRLGLEFTSGIESYAASLDRNPSSTALTAPRPDKWRQQNPEAIERILPLTDATERRLGYEPASGGLRLRELRRQLQVAGRGGDQESLGEAAAAERLHGSPASEPLAGGQVERQRRGLMRRQRLALALDHRADVDDPVRHQRGPDLVAPDLGPVRAGDGAQRPAQGLGDRAVIGRRVQQPRCEHRLGLYLLDLCADPRRQLPDLLREPAVGQAEKTRRCANRPRGPLGLGAPHLPGLLRPQPRPARGLAVGHSQDRYRRASVGQQRHRPAAAQRLVVGVRRDHQRPPERGRPRHDLGAAQRAGRASKPPRVGGHGGPRPG